MDDELKELIVWIANNAEQESALLNPYAYLSAHVGVTSLLDQICDLWGILKKEVGEVYDTAADERDKKDET